VVVPANAVVINSVDCPDEEPAPVAVRLSDLKIHPGQLTLPTCQSITENRLAPIIGTLAVNLGSVESSERVNNTLIGVYIHFLRFVRFFAANCVFPAIRTFINLD
jgi:hypothetical protein